MRRISMASGTSGAREISRIFRRASSWLRRAEAHPVRAAINRKRACRRIRTSLARCVNMQAMQVKLLFFATLSDIVGSRRLQLEIPAGSTVGDLLTQLESSYPRMKDYRRIVLTAINEEYVDQQAPVREGDEVAIFPPVSGGEVQADALTISRFGELYQITREPIDSQRIARQLLRAEDEAICVFEGVVRNNSKGKRTLDRKSVV